MYSNSIIIYIIQKNKCSSQSDWANVWHHETHSRCRDKLVRQLYWACEKDIYRLTRRNHKRTEESVQKRNKCKGVFFSVY